jgi:hypothetical protein
LPFEAHVVLRLHTRVIFKNLVTADMKVLKAACAEEYNLVGMFSRVGTGAGMGLVNGRG